MCGCVEEGVDGGGDVGPCVAGMYEQGCVCVHMCVCVDELEWEDERKLSSLSIISYTQNTHTHTHRSSAAFSSSPSRSLPSMTRRASFSCPAMTSTHAGPGSSRLCMPRPLLPPLLPPHAHTQKVVTAPANPPLGRRREMRRGHIYRHTHTHTWGLEAKAAAAIMRRRAAATRATRTRPRRRRARPRSSRRARRRGASHSSASKSNERGRGRRWICVWLSHTHTCKNTCKERKRCAHALFRKEDDVHKNLCCCVSVCMRMALWMCVRELYLYHMCE